MKFTETGLGISSREPLSSGLGTATENHHPQDWENSNLINSKTNNTTYKNWATSREVSNLWKLVAQSPDDVVSIVNYAYKNGLRVRALGMMHSFAPLTVLDSSDRAKVILVDTTTNLKEMSISSRSGSTAILKTQPGALMENILGFLEDNGYGMANVPAAGDISIGGALAIDGHGASIPSVGKNLQEGYTYGSISNLVVSFTAVVWDNGTSAYALKTFYRGDTEAKAFLTSLGKTFLTEVELLVGPSYNLRCVSYVDVPTSELFASPTKANGSTRTFASFLDQSGRVESILFPFTSTPWLKNSAMCPVWSITPEKPASSREVSSPYNYAFSNNIPVDVALLYSQIQKGLPSLAPTLGTAQFEAAEAGLLATDSMDIWGPAKNTMLYVKSTTLRSNASGYAVLTKRSNIQNVISTVFEEYTSLVKQYQVKGDYPANGPLQIRLTGLDRPEDAGIPGAESPTFSAIRPDDKNPQFDVAIWCNVLTIPGTPKANDFLTDFECFLLKTFNNGDGNAMMRPEWSKGWAYTPQGPYLNQDLLQQTIPQMHSTTSTQDGWRWALSVLNKYDPGNVFTNEFLNKFFV